MRTILLLFLILLLYPASIPATNKIEINTASLEQLDEITGIGPVLAQRIIDARPFSSIDDLLRVMGIGETTLQKIKDQGLAYIEAQQTNQTQAIETTKIQQPSVVAYPTGIVINEILPNPEGPDEQNEWVELYNQNPFDVDLTDWKIKDNVGTSTTFTIKEIIKAKGFLVLKRPETKITLNNEKDELLLIQPNENILDKASYEKSPIGQSYNKGWFWSSNLTPGKENIIFTEILKPVITTKELAKTNEAKKETASIISKIENNNPPYLIAIIISILSSITALVLFKNLNKSENKGI